ncbi:hypothetical protein LEP1GSC058_1836 [Leptospira fainei serovar Hurstbridge str. BUT 6]|uniref:Uncharacterized protein n=1 Tax=Leptospira fainei serovar Hurstbridge str. BUT 6 TaxID=1193011 RepID=S3UZX7_9LEPT|nr:hypothetical protein [Leptospira fainei]EPG74783.1 hypothetical protein LEP1GSC058_1836 [Leptospira fainei serovar Hurstbridge str. BUT 6]
MRFEILPILDQMIELYQNPLNMERFRKYLDLALNEDKTDVELPILNFNPMAKAHILSKCIELQNLHAETLLGKEIENYNKERKETRSSAKIKVSITVADDIAGSWTNRYSTDYSSKFETFSLLKRNFCTPLFFASEPLEPNMIRLRCREYILRTIFQLEWKYPKTLGEHIAQEGKVKIRTNQEDEIEPEQRFVDFYLENRNSNDRSKIFPFLYGDEAAIQFGYDPLGNADFFGFKTAKNLYQEYETEAGK